MGNQMEFKGKIKGSIAVRGIRSYAFHGMYDFEKKRGAWFETDVVLHLEWNKRPEELEETTNYEQVHRMVQDQMNMPKPLIETVCADILGALVETFGESCSAIEVTLTKAQVPIPNVGSTACEMRWEA